MKKFLVILMVFFTLSLGIVACGKPDPVYFQVTLNAADGAFEDESVTKVITVLKGDALTISELPSNGDFELDGWYTDADCYTRWNLTAGVTQDMTLYAYWASDATHYEAQSNEDGTAILTSIMGDRVTELRLPNYVTNDVGELEKVTEIGSNFMNNAAYVNSLTSLTLPKSLKFIDEWAFTKQGELTTVEIFCDLGQNVFRECAKLENVIFKGSNIIVDNAAFMECPNIKNIDLSGVETLGEHVFNANLKDNGTNSIETVITDGGLRVIGAAAFQNSTKLTSFDFNGVEEIGSWSFYQSGLTTADFTTVEKIGDNVFQNSADLETITLDGNTKSIGNSAFEGTKITQVDLNGVEILGNWTFANLEITEFDLSTVKTIGDHTFRGTKITSIDLSGVQNIGEAAFYGLTDLVTVTMNGSVKKIGKNCFSATSITSINLSGVTTIGEGAFYGLSSLATVTMNGSIRTIEAWAFVGTSFSTINLTGATSIGSGAFQNNANLTTVTWPLATISERAFEGTTSLTSFTFTGITTVGKEAFKGSGLTSANLTGVATVGESAFYGCSALATVTLGGTVKTIGKDAFRETAFTAIDLSGVETVGDAAFYGRSTLATVTMNGTVTSIGKDVFRGTAITSIDLSGVATIGDAAFYDLSTLATVTMDGSIRTIGKDVFRGTTIVSIDLTGVETIGESAFYGQTSLSTVIFGGSAAVAEIGKSAFENCSALATVTLGGGVKAIGQDALRGTKIAAIDLTGVESIGAGAFVSTKLVTVVIPASVTAIGQHIFYGLDSTLTTVDISATGATSAANIPEGWDANWAQYPESGVTIIYATAAL